MTELAAISAVCLNQFALDFEGNRKRILKSIQIAKDQSSRYRSGPELEICGYDCEDHFFETDTSLHCWQVLLELLKDETCQGIIVDVGMPVVHNGITYNCRVILLNSKILLIRPKLVMCDDGNYRESRWFTAWTKRSYVEDYHLPREVSCFTGQKTVPIGDALLALNDTTIGYEICEELWTPRSTHIDQSLAGAEIILNASGSHAEIRKASYVMEMVKTASAKCGILYLFSNLRGCGGERVYFNGCALSVLNGKTLQLGEQYSLMDVEVLTAIVDLNSIREYKTSIRSRSLIGDATPAYKRIYVDWSIRPVKRKGFKIHPTKDIEKEEFCCAEEEIGKGPALWLWDYLRRSPASGFFLPLSGGVDSSSVAIIVYSMCSLIVDFISTMHDGYEVVVEDLRRVLKDETYLPTSAKSLCGKLLTTCYMGSENSSTETRERAKNLAESIGSCHSAIDISSAVSAFLEEASKNLGMSPQFSGTKSENLALQNIQARSRMVYAYLLAQLKLWSKNSNGFLLVLGTSNVDEAIRGYFTKYDCSSADLNPIGGISKMDLKSFILYTAEKFKLEAVADIVRAPPTAELQPLSTNQTDENDMGMTYEELSTFGYLRKIGKCGPFSMVARLLHLWDDRHEPSEIARKVKHFYVSYAANRHKMTTLTPACHMENYSPEDHRFDLRPVFYPLDFTWQFRKIDELIKRVQNDGDDTCEVD